MFYRFKKGKQKELIQKAIVKAGSERKLSKLINISKSNFYYLKFEKRNLSDINLKKILEFLEIKKKLILQDINEILPDNWGRKKGGKALIKLKKEKGTFNQTISKLKKASSKRMKKWHKDMKENEPERYYTWQYERFKKIGKGYPLKLNNGIKVRNELEKEIGNFLILHFTEVRYEKYININGKAYFPDYLIGNKIIEVTEWKHPGKEKIRYLVKKIEDYKTQGYVVCFYIPKKYRKFYKEIQGSIISDLTNLHEFITMPS